MPNIAYIRKRELELEVDFKGSESQAILAMSSVRFVAYDEDRDVYRALPCVYWELKNRLTLFGFKVETEINEDTGLGFEILRKSVALRDYQENIMRSLRRKNFRGVVVLPTGAGKSIIGSQAIRELKQRTLIVVPTVELMHQWRTKIRKHLGPPDNAIGMWGGGRRSLGDITITTYQSACRREFLMVAMDRFNLIIFDETHHLPAETYIEIAKRLTAWHRIGLTATPERIDRRDRLLPIFVGDLIYGAGMRELIRRGHLARYEYEKIRIDMSDEERETYRRLMKIYRSYVRENFPKLRGREAFELSLIHI